MSNFTPQLSFLLKQAKSQEKEKAKQHHQSMIKMLFKTLNSNASDWLKTNTLELLYEYRNLAFVRKQLTELSETVSETMQLRIKEFLAGELDDSRLQEQKQRLQESEEMYARIRAEIQQENSANLESNVVNQIGLLGLRKN
jgi:hypothetical protein